MEGKYAQHYAQHDIVTPTQNPQLVTSQIEDFSYMDDSIFLMQLLQTRFFIWTN